MKVSPDTASNIRSARAYGIGLQEIARITGLSVATVYQICSGTSHATAPKLKAEVEALEYKAQGIKRGGDVLHALGKVREEKAARMEAWNKSLEDLA